MLTGLLAVGFLFTIPVLLILLINAMIRIGTIQKNLEKLEKEFWILRRQIQETKEGIEQDWKETEETVSEPEPVSEETFPAPVPDFIPEFQPIEDSTEWEPPTPPEPTPEPVTKVFQPAKPASEPSLEMLLGTRWLSTIGIIMLLFAAGFFLKLAYDNAWIGPQGRLLIGTVAGIVALGLGERFRRKQWDVLFQTLTGGGLATFYLCIFFSFQIYHLTGQSVSMTLATAVTVFAVGLAVFSQCYQYRNPGSHWRISQPHPAVFGRKPSLCPFHLYYSPGSGCSGCSRFPQVAGFGPAMFFRNGSDLSSLVCQLLQPISNNPGFDLLLSLLYSFPCYSLAVWTCPAK